MSGLRYNVGFAIWIAFAIGAQNVSHQPGGQLPYALFWLVSLFMFGRAGWKALHGQRPAAESTQKDEVVSVLASVGPSSRQVCSRPTMPCRAIAASCSARRRTDPADLLGPPLHRRRGHPHRHRPYRPIFASPALA